MIVELPNALNPMPEICLHLCSKTPNAWDLFVFVFFP